MHLLELEIAKLGPKGDGVFVGSRGPVFVEGGLPGDRIRGKAFQTRDGVARAEIVELTTSSPFRRKPACEHFAQCGGCTLQHAEEAFYREWKTDMVKAAFQQVKVWPERWLNTVFLESQNRRRITLTATRKRKLITLGYYKRRSQEVTAIDKCLVADPQVWGIRTRLLRHLPDILEDGDKVDIFIQQVGAYADVVFTGKFGENGEPDDLLRKKLLPLIEGSSIRRLSWRPDEHSGPTVLHNRGPFSAKFGKLVVFLPPAAFLQPTVAGEKTLVDAVMAALPEKGRFADLFSGCGTFSGSMLAKGMVDSYEMNVPSVNALTKAANGRALRVFRRDLFKHPLKRDELNRYDAIVFDPPRAGCAEQVENLAESKVGTLIGVSCNPATFARDAKLLVEGGYWLESLQVVDQFQWSHHVEVVGVFRKKKAPKQAPLIS